MSKLDVLYEDNHIIVVVKPPNTLTQGDSTGDVCLLDMVKTYVKEKYNKPGDVYIGMVHRLDRPVGGVIVFARTSKAATRLSLAIKEDKIDREYLAVVHGTPRSSNFLEHWLLKDENNNLVKAFANEVFGAKLAKLEYNLIEGHDGLSLVKVKLHTGRSHQIRVQLSQEGLPIFGDMKYGKMEKGNIALWSYSLGFIHPVKKEYMQFKILPVNPPFDQFDLKKL